MLSYCERKTVVLIISNDNIQEEGMILIHPVIRDLLNLNPFDESNLPCNPNINDVINTFITALVTKIFQMSELDNMFTAIEEKYLSEDANSTNKTILIF